MNLNDILSERLAIVGGTGSGKSYTARGLVERVLAKASGRVGIIDPTGVWWGLRLKPDGKSAGFPVILFGGDHSDVPLIETAGRVIAQAVASTHQSWIIDTSALKSKASERRFMLDFLDAIFETNREDITLVVDEADRFSPQRMNPESARLHERMEEIVRRGRVRGFTPWLITQRPASLNKDVLSQATAYISMSLTGKHDRDAMADVIEGQADKQVAKAIVDAMPRHKTGQGLVWAPKQSILLPVNFPEIATFDSMRAPKPGERRREKALPPIDLGALREKMATVEVEAKANDPRLLKAEIAKLKADLVKAQKPGPMIGVDPKEMKAEYERGFDAGWADADSRWTSRMEKIGEQMEVTREAIAIPLLKPKFQRVDIPHTPKAASPQPAAPVRTHSPAPPPPRREVSGNGELTNPQRTLLKALAWWKAMGHDEPRRPQVAAIAGWAASSSHLKNRLSELKTAGLIEYPRDGFVRLTDTGAQSAPEPDLSATMVDGIRRVLTNPQRTLFEALLSAKVEVDRDWLAQAVGWEAGSSHLKNRLSELSTLEVVTYPKRGTVALSDWLGVQ